MDKGCAFRSTRRRTRPEWLTDRLKDGFCCRARLRASSRTASWRAQDRGSTATGTMGRETHPLAVNLPGKETARERRGSRGGLFRCGLSHPTRTSSAGRDTRPRSCARGHTPAGARCPVSSRVHPTWPSDGPPSRSSTRERHARPAGRTLDRHVPRPERRRSARAPVNPGTGLGKAAASRVVDRAGIAGARRPC